MLTQISKPEEFSHLEGYGHFFDVSVGGTSCALVAVEQVDVSGYIHIEVPRWTKEIGRTIVQDFLPLKEYLSSVGITKLIATNENLEDERKWTKFIELFGFPRPEKMLYSIREI